MSKKNKEEYIDIKFPGMIDPDGFVEISGFGKIHKDNFPIKKTELKSMIERAVNSVQEIGNTSIFGDNKKNLVITHNNSEIYFSNELDYNEQLEISVENSFIEAATFYATIEEIQMIKNHLESILSKYVEKCLVIAKNQRTQK